MPTSTRSRALLALGLAVVLIGAFLGIRAVSRGDEPVAAPPSQSPSAAASPQPPAEIPQPKPFVVKVQRRSGGALDSSNMFGRKRDVRPGAVRRGSRGAIRSLQRYLNGAFVRPQTRFTQAPIRQLLTKDAYRLLSPAGRKALGQGGPKFKGGTTSFARARVRVLFRGPTTISATVRYRARLNAILPQGRQPMISTGVLVFVPSGGSWKADMAEVQLLRPDPDAKKQQKPKPKPKPKGRDKGSN